MTAIYQKTLANSVTTSGVGLHSGNECSVTISPREPNFGIKFVSMDDPLKTEIRVAAETLDGRQLGTNITQENTCIRTVEHLLSAVVALGLHNALISVSGGEIPIKDGSAKHFIELIQKGGLVEQNELKKLKSLNQGILMEFAQEKSISIKPTPNTNDVVITMEVDFDNKITKELPQRLCYVHSQESYIHHIGLARTFGFKKDIDALLDAGLVLGGSLSNAILIGNDKILNKEGLQFNDELVAHKILDIIGDFYPLLNDYCGFEIIAHKAGHFVNNKTLKALAPKLT